MSGRDKQKRACKGTRDSSDSGVDSAADQGLDGNTVLVTESVRALTTVVERVDLLILPSRTLLVNL